jgi:hypothetical protein
MLGDPTGDYFSGIEIQDGADVMELSGDLDIGEVADPNHVRCLLVKTLGKQVVA